MKNLENKYPFEEGDRYFTIEDGAVIESVWDDVSEEMYDENHNRDLFATEQEAVLMVKLVKASYRNGVMQTALEKIIEGSEEPIEIAENVLEAIALGSDKIIISRL